MEQRCSLHSLIADAVVQTDSAVLLVQVANPPDASEGWRLPGDQLRHGEHPEVCIRRVLREQLGLEPERLELAEVESIPGQNWQLIFHYRCDVDRLPAPVPGIQDARFFQLEHLPSTAHGAWEKDVIYRIITANTKAEGGRQ